MNRREEAGLLRELRAAAGAIADPGEAFDAALRARLRPRRGRIGRLLGGVAAVAAAVVLAVALRREPARPALAEPVGPVEPFLGSLGGPGPVTGGEVLSLSDRDFELLMAWLDGR